MYGIQYNYFTIDDTNLQLFYKFMRYTIDIGIAYNFSQYKNNNQHWLRLQYGVL